MYKYKSGQTISIKYISGQTTNVKFNNGLTTWMEDECGLTKVVGPQWKVGRPPVDYGGPLASGLDHGPGPS